MGIEVDTTGLRELIGWFDELSEKIDNDAHHKKALKRVGDQVVSDLMKLPKPKSNIKKPGYTHLVDSFSWRYKEDNPREIEIGWGKHYGRMVEFGTKHMKRQPHLWPTYKTNEKKYLRTIIRYFEMWE